MVFWTIQNLKSKIQNHRFSSKGNEEKRDFFISFLTHFFREVSLIGKAVVLKTTAPVACEFESRTFRQIYFGFLIADFGLKA
jgi:hypothetical protein